MTIYKVQLEKNNRVFDKNIHIDNKNKNPEAEVKTFLKSYEKEGFKIIKDGLKDSKDNIIDKANFTTELQTQSVTLSTEMVNTLGYSSGNRVKFREGLLRFPIREKGKKE